ncbi:MAG: Zn-ribbon domain-containing OB-fold protein [Chloroflexi bacterium]|nr:Zn-ribbon domain-containing OB-fold protein [Chloroflexota bacterium]MYD49229.1 Zn-ribbon domain-containing OB-fold protein [Chloroflexota bacterium]
MTTAAPQIPLPVPQPESDFYWEKCKAGELWLRRCACGERTFFYPRDFCPFPDCFRPGTEWVQSSGRGTLHTFAIVHRAPIPAFRDKVPYITAVVELEEGARIPTWLVGIDFAEGEIRPDAVQCGMPVTVVFEKIDDNITLPMFRPA